MNHNHPPTRITEYLRRYCDDELIEGIEGDLVEMYEEEVQVLGLRRAKWNYTLRVIGFLRPVFRKQVKRQNQLFMAMWKNHLISAFRSMKNQKQYALINIFGLALGLTCLALVMIFALNEFKYDRFHSNYKQIYRVYKKNVNQEKGTSVLSAETSGLMGPAMVQNFPEVLKFVRINPWYDDAVISYETTHLRTKKLVIADSSLFDVFSFKLLRGNKQSALSNPSSIVLSESFARSLFGEEDPVGKIVIGLEDLPYMVTGIVEDAPPQSHIQYDAFMSWSTTVPGVGPLNWAWLNNWLTQALYTYVLLDNHADPDILTEKLPQLIATHLPDRVDSYLLRLQPMRSIHLDSKDILYTRKMDFGSIDFVLLLLISGALILLIAGVNYVNISLAKVSKNLKEVGLRKVIGSSKSQIIARFLTESILHFAASMVLAFVAIGLLLPVFETLTGKNLPFESLLDLQIIGMLLGLLVVTLLLIGFYPAVLISKYTLTALLSNGIKGSGVGPLRKILLISQYAIAIGLIIIALHIHKQTDFLLTRTATSDEQVMVVDLDNEVGLEPDLLVEKVEQHPSVISVSACQAAIGSGTFGTTVLPEGHPNPVSTQIFRVDAHFDKTYALEMIEGNFFRAHLASDSNGLIINKAFMEYVGWKSAVGKQVRFSPDGEKMPILGVIDDFHFRSPAEVRIAPLIMYLQPENRRNLSIRLRTENLSETIGFFESVWSQIATRTPFDFFFVDRWFEEQYKSEVQMLRIATTFAMISLLLCVLGLFGLTSLMLEQRMKEISVRKVLGAGTYSLAILFNQQFLYLFLCGFFISVPLTWWLTSNWLNSFAYHIDLSMFSFVLACLGTLFISVLTVSLLTLRVSLVNPAVILKSE